MFWRRIFKKGYKIKMPTKKTTTTTKTTKSTGVPVDTVTSDHVAEMIDRALRQGFHDQARDLETHLTDIDARLRALENKP